MGGNDAQEDAGQRARMSKQDTYPIRRARAQEDGKEQCTYSYDVTR